MSLFVGGAFLKGSSILMGASKTVPVRNNCTQLLLWFAAAPFWEHTVGLAKAELKHCRSLAIPLKTCVYPASKSTQPSNCKETCGQHYILMTSPCVSVSESEVCFASRCCLSLRIILFKLALHLLKQS